MSTRHPKPGSWVVAAVLFMLLLLLAIFTEWEYDEAWTYMDIIGLSPYEIASYSKYNIANNHILNSLYFYVLQSAGIKSAVYYRILSLLVFWVYVYYIKKLLANDKRKENLVYEVALYLMPFLIFFSLGRGYSLALAGFAASLYYFKLMLVEKCAKNLWGFVLTGSISSLSLFSFVIPFIAMLIWVCITCYKSILAKKQNLLAFLLVLPVLMYINQVGHIINISDKHIVGGDSFFKNGTLSSIVTFMCLYDYLPHNVFTILKIAYLLSLASALVMFFLQKKLSAEMYVIVLSLLLMVALHYVLGAKYPYYRSVSYIPLLLVLMLASVQTHKLLITQHFYVIAAIGCINLFVFIRQVFSANTKDALTYVANHGGRVLVSDNFNPNISLYNKLYFNDSLKVTRVENYDQDSLFFPMIDSADIILCENNKLETAGKATGFEKVYELPFNALYVRKK